MSNGRPSDVERFRLKLVSHIAQEPSIRPSRYHGRFLKGPIPLPWLQAASNCPGKALHVAIVLGYLAGLNRSVIGLKCSYALLQDFGVTRHSAYRALRRLERAHLVTVMRAHGRCPVVSLEQGQDGG